MRGFSDEDNCEHVVESLQALALPFKDQIGLFPQFADIPNELAIIFGDCLEVVEDLEQFSKWPLDARVLIGQLEDRLEELAGVASAWTAKALECDGRWEELRELAARSLKVLGRSVERPGFGWMQYVPTPGRGRNSKDDS